MVSTMAKRSIQEVYGCSEDEDFGYGLYDYSPMLSEWEILLSDSQGDYQGATMYLLRDADSGRYGLVTIAYGSCSGCDALQGCSTWADVESLREHIHEGIHWENPPSALSAWIHHRDWETQPAYYESEFARFMQEVSAFLLTLHLEKKEQK